MRTKKPIVEALRRQIAEEAPESLDRLTFFAEQFGLGSSRPLAFDEEGLKQVESWYRELAKRGFGEEPFDKETYERLMGHFLGETLIRNKDGEWYAYVGREHTRSPVVIRFPDLGKAVEITSICADLDSSSAHGARQGEVLLRFYKKARDLAMIKAK